MLLSRICAAAQGDPNRAHRPCTGCDCTCHHVAAPADFRALVEAAREDQET